MKKRTKLGLGIIAFLGGAVLLTGCTNSFCSKEDKAHIAFAFDEGFTRFVDTEKDATYIENAKNNGCAVKVGLDGNPNLSAVASYHFNPYTYTILVNGYKNYNFEIPSLNYYIEFDTKVLKLASEEAGIKFEDLKVSDIGSQFFDLPISTDAKGNKKYADASTFRTGVLTDYGYLKFYQQTEEKEYNKLWVNWNEINNKVRTEGNVDINECPSTDMIKFYQGQINSKVNTYRSCIAIDDGYYGRYNGKEARISGKDWGYAWKTGPLSGLLVYPISWAVGSLTKVMIPSVGNGVAQLFAILIVTIIVRGLMLVATFKQTLSSQKMQALQPEIAKIQAKYPNSNTNQYEKQRLAEETSKLYKKHKINPFTSLLVMIVQFPVFICVWSALQGNAWLSSGAFLGLNLSASIREVTMTWSNWAVPSSGVYTALVLFLLMAGAQVVAMLLPQWLQKKRMKNVQKLGRNPAQKQNTDRMKWFTYIMMIMIIIMGFSLASAMVVYWLVGALFSIAQTLITGHIMNKPHKSKK